MQGTDSLNTAVDSLQSANELSFSLDNILANDGILITVAGYVVVFLALLLLYFIFTNLTKVLNFNLRKRLRASGKVTDNDNEDLNISGEINAAIAMTLLLHYQEVHDYEDAVLTIKKVQKTYSPWSSKIYGLRQTPR